MARIAGFRAPYRDVQSRRTPRRLRCARGLGARRLWRDTDLRVPAKEMRRWLELPLLKNPLVSAYSLEARPLVICHQFLAPRIICYFKGLLKSARTRSFKPQNESE